MLYNDVLIVGAGPTGLMMALALERYQVPVRIVDQKEGVTPFSKALGMHARSLEIFRDLKLDDRLLAAGHPISALEFYQGLERLAKVRFDHLPTRYPFILAIAQAETEKILLEALQEKGIHVEWNAQVVGLTPHPERVDVTISSRNCLSHSSHSWVIGCDGLHSVVRDATHIPFVGTKDEHQFVVADLQIEGGFPREVARGYLGNGKEGLAMLLPFDERKVRVVLDGYPERTPPSLEYIQREVSQRTKEPFILQEMTWSSVFRIQYKHATLFSKGRCFLAGDAAHVHSPVGGQGMNSGLQDAYNLAWKLALVYHGKGSYQLLNTYHEERYKNAKRLLHVTHLMTKIGARQTLLFEYLTPWLLRFLFKHQEIHDQVVLKMSQLQINYRCMSLSKEYFVNPLSKKNRAFRKGPHAGERVISLPVILASTRERKTLCDVLPGTGFHLVIFLPTAYAKDKAILDQIHKLEHPQVTKLLVVEQEHPKESDGTVIDENGRLHLAYGATRPCMYLIRPDQYIGMRSIKLSQARLTRYLKKVFR